MLVQESGEVLEVIRWDFNTIRCYIPVRLETLYNHIGGIIVSMLDLNAVDCEFEQFKPWSIQSKGCKMDICCFSVIKHTQ